MLDVALAEASRRAAELEAELAAGSAEATDMETLLQQDEREIAALEAELEALQAEQQQQSNSSDVFHQESIVRSVGMVCLEGTLVKVKLGPLCKLPAKLEPDQRSKLQLRISHRKIELPVCTLLINRKSLKRPHCADLPFRTGRTIKYSHTLDKNIIYAQDCVKAVVNLKTFCLFTVVKGADLAQSLSGKMTNNDPKLLEWPNSA